MKKNKLKTGRPLGDLMHKDNDREYVPVFEVLNEDKINVGYEVGGEYIFNNLFEAFEAGYDLPWLVMKQK